MDIDLKCGADIRMTQHLAQALYIYPRSTQREAYVCRSV